MSDGGNGGFDLSQFYQVFFEEAGENLDNMEQLLLNLDVATADDEELNAIFRCAHSIKGGAATFGFKDVAELTHEMETLLDKLRRHELQATPPMVDVLLESGDALKGLLARHQGSSDEVLDTTGLVRRIMTLSHGEAAAAPAASPATVDDARAAEAPAGAAGTADDRPQEPAAAASVSTAAASAAPPTKGERRELELRVGPLSEPERADTLIELFKEIVDLGTIEPLDGGRSADGMRRFRVVTQSTDDDLLDLFTFHVAREEVQIVPFGPGYGFHEGAPGAPGAAGGCAAAPADTGYGFFDNAPGSPSASGTLATSGTSVAAASVAATAIPHQPSTTPASAPATRAAAPKAEAKGVAASGGNLESSTLRVSVEKVDQLINLVGELVITQAMLAQNSKGLDGKLEPDLTQQLASNLSDLERNTRDLQEAVMSIRMIPMSMVFNRFPRMLRDLASKLGKKVELVTQGEATELDKGLVEKITDPLTHLVRNSCDHGIELPADRLARGKPETGTITLIASHQGGSIVIEVRDDGRGMNREKLIKKAREKGIDAPDSMTDSEVWNLIFAPGFSTAEQVTDVSGRGVGMDVVKKNITSLGGTVEIDSAEGYGMSVKVRLPLTLAIMDGMSVGVGPECYILPLASVVESFQVQDGMVKTIGGTGRVVKVREEYMPVVDLQNIFSVPGDFSDEPQSNILTVVEAEGSRVALRITELLGQQQVVVKNLEANYRKVSNVSGATIMGDGRVALILDVGSLVRHARH